MSNVNKRVACGIVFGKFNPRIAIIQTENDSSILCSETFQRCNCRARMPQNYQEYFPSNLKSHVDCEEFLERPVIYHLHISTFLTIILLWSRQCLRKTSRSASISEIILSEGGKSMVER